jgi:hypothetical protein
VSTPSWNPSIPIIRKVSKILLRVTLLWARPQSIRNRGVQHKGSQANPSSLRSLSLKISALITRMRVVPMNLTTGKARRISHQTMHDGRSRNS